MNKRKFGAILMCIVLLTGCSSAQKEENSTAEAKTVENNQESLNKKYSVDDQKYEEINEQYDLKLEEDQGSKFVCAYEKDNSIPTFKIYVETSENDQLMLEMYNLQENELMYCYGEENSYTIYAVDSELNYISLNNHSIEDSKNNLTEYMKTKDFSLEDMKGALVQYYLDQNQ